MPSLLSHATPAYIPAAPWMPDLGDGTYQNPVLFADYSDPDAIRVGRDYYLVSSSFHAVPGLPLLHSRDLVNWTLLNHALQIQVPAEHFSQPRHGQGVWAPALRHHGGKFWIFYPDPDFGLYVVTATDPAGTWSAPHLLKAGRGLIDPCPFWDADGSLWLVHGWAKSRAGINNRITLHAVSSDARHLLDEGRVIIDADLLPGIHTLEGPKLYSRNGYYYIFAPANGVATGEQFVFRSRSLTGPYEHRMVLAQGETPINGPHQGAWVDTPEGGNWFLHFQDRGASGRVVHLQPMVWNTDDWPVIGSPGSSGIGQPVLRHRKPRIAVTPCAPATSDEFSGPHLSLAWQWQANPRPEWFSLTARPGCLRLSCVPAAEGLYAAPHILAQKFPAPAFVVSVKLDGAALVPGDRAGLIIFGHSYAWIGLHRTSSGLHLTQIIALKAHQPDAVERECAGFFMTDSTVHLRVIVGPDAVCRFQCQFGDSDFHPLGEPFTAARGRWVGAKVGLFATACAARSGHADFTSFEITNPSADTSVASPSPHSSQDHPALHQSVPQP